MASPVLSPATTLQIRRTFNAPREKLFQAWVDPKKMTEWFCSREAERDWQAGSDGCATWRAVWV